MHCWAWKQAASKLGSGSAANSRRATRQSSSDFASHSRTISFIQYPTLIQCLADQRIPLFVAPHDLLRRAHDQIDGKPRADRLPHAERLSATFAFKRHDDDQVHIGIVRRRAVAIRTEQDDLFS